MEKGGYDQGYEVCIFFSECIIPMFVGWICREGYCVRPIDVSICRCSLYDEYWSVYVNLCIIVAPHFILFMLLVS